MLKENKMSAKEVVEFLNELLEIDPFAMNALFNIRVFCNTKLADHETVQVLGVEGGVGSVGFIGILNGMFGVDEDGWGIIAADLTDGKINRFELLKPNTKGQKKEK